jgi:hypothetical protein
MGQIVGKTPSVYVLVFENQERFSEIEKALDYNGWVSEVIREFVTSGTGRLYAAVVLDSYNKPSHLCRLVRRQTAGLDRRSVGISELEELTSKDSEIIGQLILNACKRRRDTPLELLGRLTPAENDDLIKALDKRSSTLADALRNKGRADDRILADYTPQEREIVGLERDAVGLALEIAFNDREQITVGGSAGKHQAFLSMLNTGNLTEDEIILHEKNTFPGLERLRGANPKVTEFDHNGSTLRVIHANRTRLEHTLGVDLIYISEYFGSFVGVQYKMMQGSSEKAHFSPDDGFRKQLNTMRGLWSKMEDSPGKDGQRDYRLNRIPFYFKFVSRLETNFSDDSLCPGLYLPFDLVSRIEAARPRERIGRKGETRHLTNTEFANLIHQGWIGANVEQATTIERLVDTALSQKRSVTVGIEKIAPHQRQQRMRW